jgi:hypothetical protein
MMGRHTHIALELGPPRGFPVSGDYDPKASGLCRILETI